MEIAVPNLFTQSEFEKILLMVKEKIGDYKRRIDAEELKKKEEGLASSNNEKSMSLIKEKIESLTQAHNAMTQLHRFLENTNSIKAIPIADKADILKQCEKVLPVLSEHRDKHWFITFIRSILALFKTPKTEAQIIVEGIQASVHENEKKAPKNLRYGDL